jgi:hypothetical protein
MGFWEDLTGRGPGQADAAISPYNIDQSAFRSGQTGDAIYNTLMGQMAGTDQTLENQMKQGLLRAGQSQRAMSANRAGMGAGTAQRLGAYGAGETAQQMAAQLPILRAQQQMAAEQQMQRFLAQEMAARMREEQLRAAQQEYLNQLRMQQDLYNASTTGGQGLLGSVAGPLAAAGMIALMSSGGGESGAGGESGMMGSGGEPSGAGPPGGGDPSAGTDLISGSTW